MWLENEKWLHVFVNIKANRRLPIINPTALQFWISEGHKLFILYFIKKIPANLSSMLNIKVINLAGICIFYCVSTTFCSLSHFKENKLCLCAMLSSIRISPKLTELSLSENSECRSRKKTLSKLDMNQADRETDSHSITLFFREFVQGRLRKRKGSRNFINCFRQSV
jgi:hypothetical protein